MVSQEIILEAIRYIGKPFTTKDIVDYLREIKNIVFKWDLKSDIATCLAALRRWQIVDRLPNGHNIQGHAIWYLIEWGNPHDPNNCKKCNAIKRGHRIGMMILIRKSAQRKFIRKEGIDDLMDNGDFEERDRGFNRFA